MKEQPITPTPPPSLQLPAQSQEVVPASTGVGSGMNESTKSALGGILSAMNGVSETPVGESAPAPDAKVSPVANLDEGTTKGIAGILGAMDTTKDDTVIPEAAPAPAPSVPEKIQEGNVKEWIVSKINGALISLGVPKDKWDSIEDAIFTAAMSGELGDGLPSSETAEAIADMITELAGTSAAPTEEPDPDMVIEPAAEEPPEEFLPPEEPGTEEPTPDMVIPAEEPAGDIEVNIADVDDVAVGDIPDVEDEIAAMIDVLAKGDEGGAPPEEEVPEEEVEESTDLKEYGLGPALAAVGATGVGAAVGGAIGKVSTDYLDDIDRGPAVDILNSLGLPPVLASVERVMEMLKQSNNDIVGVTNAVSSNRDSFESDKEKLVPSAYKPTVPPPPPATVAADLLDAESYIPGQKVMVAVEGKLIEAHLVDIKGDTGFFDTGDGVLRETSISNIDSLAISESYVDQILEGKDVIEVIDLMIKVETLRR